MIGHKAFGLPLDVYFAWAVLTIILFSSCDATKAVFVSLALPACIAGMNLAIRYSAVDVGNRDID